jgi:hypothetical protein
MPDLLACGFEEKNLYGYISKGYSTLPNIKEKGRLLFPFDGLGDKYKEAITKVYGDVHEYMAKKPIKELVVYDLEAEKFFLDNGFDYDIARKKATAASWLNMLLKMYDDKKFIKNSLKLTLDVFNSNVVELIKIEKVELPTSFERLIYKKDSMLKRYKENKYEALVHGNTGKQNAIKVEAGECEYQLFELLKHPNDYDDVFVTILYNAWAKSKGYKNISVSTTTAKRIEWAEKIAPTRHGWSHTNDKYIKQVKRLPASTMHPLALVESDDYNINYYFKGQDGNPFNRYVSYLVIDSATGLLLGKSYRVASAPVFDMVKLAWLDAMHYIKDLTGDWHLPYEVKADHWQRKIAHPFFKQIGKFIEPGIGNKHRGYIEPFFGSAHAKRCEKLPAHNLLNYNGNNVTAANRGVNVEAIQLYQKQRPSIGSESDTQVEQFTWLMRNMPAFTKNNMNAPSKQDTFLQRWKETPAHIKRPISHMQMLYRFGFVHQPQGRSITITNRGIEPVIDGIKYSYDLPDYNNQVHLVDRAEVFVVYDPFDMNEVLITDFKEVQFMAKHTHYHTAAVAYHQPGSRAALNMVLSEKKELAKKLNSAANTPLHGAGIDPKAIMLNGYQPKELTAAAEQAYHEQPAQQDEERQEYLDYQRSKINHADYQ